MVSLSPPEGGVVVFAQPHGNIRLPRMKAAGTSGMNFFRFIFPF
jgi:hypothetical protein